MFRAWHTNISSLRRRIRPNCNEAEKGDTPLSPIVGVAYNGRGIERGGVALLTLVLTSLLLKLA